MSRSRGLRLACNRDELRSRPPANPPELRAFADRLALMPIDPVSDGTWVGVSDAGVVFALLNRHAVDRIVPDGPLQSRGRIIPALAHCTSAADAAEKATELDPHGYQPFRLVILDRQTCAQVTGGSAKLRIAQAEWDSRPLLFTSSGLGDAEVAAPRRRLFASMLREGVLDAKAQDAFHRHRWADRPHLSVCMSRSEARTVSYTVIELTSRFATMRYLPHPPNVTTAPPIIRSLALKLPAPV